MTGSFRRRLCAAMLTLEAVVLGLTAPVLISVLGVSVPVGLWTGLGLAGACLVAAGLLRRNWGYWLGWAIQVVALVVGVVFSLPSLVVLAVIFGGLWATAYFGGDRIDRERAAAYAEFDG